MITPNQVHVVQALANISVAYQNPDLVFQKEVGLVVPVDKLSDVYFKFSKQQFRQQPDSLRPGVDAEELVIDLDARGFYNCDGHGINHVIPDRVAYNADPGADLDIEITQKTTEIIRLNEEINGASLVSNPAVITQTLTLSGTDQWTDYTNSDPFKDIDNAKLTIRQSTGLPTNRMLISEYGFLKLRNHPKLIDRVKYTQDGVRVPLTAEELAKAFQLEKVVVAGALKQANPEGQADSLSFIWGKNALLYYVPPRPGKRTAALAYTFVSTVAPLKSGDARMVPSVQGFLVKKWREEGRDSELLGIRYYYDQRIIEPNCGFLYVNAFK